MLVVAVVRLVVAELLELVLVAVALVEDTIVAVLI
jgi:hypothetical protein